MRSDANSPATNVANSPQPGGCKFSRPYNLFPPAMPALLGDMIATSRGISPPHFSAFNPLLADRLPIASRRVLFPPAFGFLTILTLCGKLHKISAKGAQQMLTSREFNFAGFYYFYCFTRNKSDSCCINSHTEGI